jgi:hypothetical protein
MKAGNEAQRSDRIAEYRLNDPVATLRCAPGLHCFAQLIGGLAPAAHAQCAKTLLRTHVAFIEKGCIKYFLVKWGS